MDESQRIRQRLAFIRHYFPGVDIETITDEEFAMLSEEAMWLHEQFLVHNTAKAFFHHNTD